MSMIPWSNMFSVGIREVDRQHQVLVNLINDLAHALETRDKHIDNRGVIDELVRYAAYHFSTEERLMRENSYRDIEQHLAEHQAFVQKVRQLAGQLQQGQNPSPEELVAFLRDWLVSHILHSDRDMGDALNAAGIR